MKIKLLIAVAMCTILLLTQYGCTTRKIEYSAIMHEKGIVEDLVFVPDGDGRGIIPSVTMGGGMTIGVVNVSIPEKYAAVLKCKNHGVKFIIEDNQEKAKDLWKRLSKGQEVTIDYRQVYEVIREGGFFNDRLISRKIVDLDFVDAK